MNKRFIMENANNSPSIRRLRSGLTIQSKEIATIPSEIINEQSSVLLSNTDEQFFIYRTNECNENRDPDSDKSDDDNDLTDYQENDTSDEDDLSVDDTSESDSDEDGEFYIALTEEINKLCITTKDFYLSKTIRNGQKLCSFGYYYTKERTTKKGFIHWKCEDTLTCTGRAHSEGEDVEITIAHSHKPDIARKYKLINDEKIKELAIKSKDNPRDILIETQKSDDEDVVLKSSYNNLRQVISRVRQNKAGYDTGPSDENRILLFTTEDNLRLLEKYRDWYCDGTFDISPVLFKQLYSIHIVVNNKDLPLVYALLPNKKQSSYTKLFRLIKSFTTKEPKTINVDFEKAVFNSVKTVFKESKFKEAFMMHKALCYVPESDVVYVFKQLKSQLDKSFDPFFKYIEKYYIGKKKKEINQTNVLQAPSTENFWGCLCEKVYEGGWQASTEQQLINEIFYGGGQSKAFIFCLFTYASSVTVDSPDDLNGKNFEN
ncbi:hypothetical protein BpHYR1_024196 [Brachionus plicatilis]|uniref:FLYWCH-type domain-containing protein n=1 Tax=Brachionus plicatilis TaxID=10195 RepID=A0A3M7SJ80_BRAPC|nr:hypothetical protein BpHYR1_024196 [Brachionus plicatilis]